MKLPKNKADRADPPLWWTAAPTQEYLHSFCAWAATHRIRWSEWGHLAESVGPAALNELIWKLFETEAVAVTAIIVAQLHDPASIELGAVSRGSVITPIATHRFQSVACQRAFMRWSNLDVNLPGKFELARIAWLFGAETLGKCLDELARDHMAKSRD